MSLSNQTTQDKNALVTDAVFLVLLEIEIPNVPTVRLVNNTEDITWNYQLWQQFPFEFSDISESSKSEVSQWSIKISNTNRVIERYLHEYNQYLKLNGVEGNDISCIIRVVNSKDLTNSTAVLEHTALLQQPTTNSQWATFKLSAKNPYNKQFPPRKIFKNFCAWKFKSTQCGYSGTGEFCDKVLTTCRNYNNSPRFGAFIGVAGRGLILVR